MKSVLKRCAFWVVCLLAYSGASAQYNFRPHVINENEVDSVLFEYKASDFITHLIFKIDDELYPMYDDGTHGDRVPDDHVFTIALDPHRFLSSMQPDDAFKPEVGTLIPYIGGKPAKSVAIFAQVRSDVMPDVPIASVSESLQMSPRIINIRSSTLLSYQNIFRQLHLNGISREADFLNIVCLPSKTSMSTYESLRNDVSGLGLPLYNLVNDPVVSAKFKGVLTLPITTKFDGAARNMVRAYARQWLPHLGSPFSVCEQWAVSDLARSITGYDKDGIPQCMSVDLDYLIVPIEGTDNYGFIYAPEDIKYFNSLELYLMGLGSSSDVGAFKVFDDQMAVLNALRMQPTGYRGTVHTYEMADIISLLGERSPAYGDAPSSFRVYTVVLSPELLTREEMAYYDYMAARGEGTEIVHTRDGYVKELGSPFEAATKGAGKLTWKVHALVFPQKTMTMNVCYGDVFSFNGVEYSEPGVVQGIIENENGKDTLVTIVMNWLPKNEAEIQTEICAGETYDLNGILLDESGEYFDTLKTASGCDSFVKLDLTVRPEGGSELFVALCDGEEFEFGGEFLSESGVYTDVVPNAYGCDSTIVLTLDIDDDIDGGHISAFGEQEYFTVCIGDGIQDEFRFVSTAEYSNYVFVITDQYDIVIEILSQPYCDFEFSGPKPELVRGISYSGELLLKPGDHLFTTEISDSCSGISDNYLEIHKQSEGLYCSMLEKPPYDREVDFTVAPNPVTDQLNITLRSRTETLVEGTLEVIEVSGVTKLSNRVGIYPGLNTWLIDVGNYAPGIYIARIPEAGSVIRFVKI